jgi:hypothetical protein
LQRRYERKEIPSGLEEDFVRWDEGLSSRREKTAGLKAKRGEIVVTS